MPEPIRPGDVTLTLSYSELWVLRELLNDAIDVDRTVTESHQPLLDHLNDELGRILLRTLDAGRQRDPYTVGLLLDPHQTDLVLRLLRSEADAAPSDRYNLALELWLILSHRQRVAIEAEQPLLQTDERALSPEAAG